MKHLSHNVDYMGVRGIIFMGLHSYQILKCTYIWSGSRDGYVEFFLPDQGMELMADLSISKAYMSLHPHIRMGSAWNYRFWCKW